MLDSEFGWLDTNLLLQDLSWLKICLLKKEKRAQSYSISAFQCIFFSPMSTYKPLPTGIVQHSCIPLIIQCKRATNRKVVYLLPHANVSMPSSFSSLVLDSGWTHHNDAKCATSLYHWGRKIASYHCRLKSLLSCLRIEKCSHCTCTFSFYVQFYLGEHLEDE